MKNIEIVSNDKLVGTFMYGKYRIYAIDGGEYISLWIGRPETCDMSICSFCTRNCSNEDIKELLNSGRDTIDKFIKDYEKSIAA